MNTKRKPRQFGFTLIELMVVIAIIGVLATVVAVNLFAAGEEGNVAAVKQQISNFETALEQYRIRNRQYPTTEQGLQALIAPQRFLNSSSVPNDPWGNPYVYRRPGPDGMAYEIISYGADGAPGGTDYNADISSATMR